MSAPRFRFVVGALIAVVMVVWMIRDARAFDCVSKTLSPLGTGTAGVMTRISVGECAGWWCPISTQADGAVTWKTNKQCVLDKYRKSLPDPLTTLESVITAPDLLTALNAAADAASITPAGQQEAYDYALLKWSACTDLTKPANLPPNVTLTASCGDAPTPPGPIADIWRALGTAIYTTGNGKLVAPTGSKAAAGALCDGTATPIPGAVIYLPILGGIAGQVTSCKKAAQ